ncbi:MAG: glycosyltransferase family 4 protein [Candidatus Doudnabacteria bacterium]|nr:glycosyltransferase family 4 protein [Candidatus Doudnabacteria bacterium]
MKILIASGTYPPELGGMATFVKNFADRALAQGHAVKLIAYGQADSLTRDPFWTMIISRNTLLAVRYLRYFLAAFSEARKCDFIFAQDLVSSGIPAFLASVFSAKKLVLRLGGDFLWEKMVQKGRIAGLNAYYDLPKSLIEKVYLFFYRLVLRRAKKIIFNSVLQADLYHRHFNLPESKTAVIYNPVGRQTIVQAQKRYFRLVFAGRFIKVKNIPLILSALKSVPSIPELLLVGDGPEKNSLPGLIEREKLQGRVKILQSMQGNEFAKLIAESWAVVIPSFTELSPNLALECIGLHVPVLLTSFNGLPQDVRKALLEFNPFKVSELVERLHFLLNQQNYENYLKTLKTIRLDRGWTEVLGDYQAVFSNL